MMAVIKVQVAQGRKKLRSKNVIAQGNLNCVLTNTAPKTVWQLFYSVGKHLSLVLNTLGVVQYTNKDCLFLQSER